VCNPIVQTDMVINGDNGANGGNSIVKFINYAAFPILLALLSAGIGMLYRIQGILDTRNEMYFTPIMVNQKTIIENQDTILSDIRDISQHMNSIIDRLELHEQENKSLNDAELRRLDDVYQMLESKSVSPPIGTLEAPPDAADHVARKLRRHQAAD